MATSRGWVKINENECKGCGLCVSSCPPHCLELAPELNHFGVHAALYQGQGCTGCGICYYTCPEPGAISVFRRLTLYANPQEAPHAASV